MLYRTRQIREERRQRFDELKRLHRPPQTRRFGATQALGLVLMGVAVFAALDPDYPIPRELARTASASARVYLLPEGESPDPATPVEDWEFAWSWDGPDVTWQLVLLGSDFVACASMDEIRGAKRVRPNAVLQQAIREGRARYWYVAAELEGHPFRSMPLPVPGADAPEGWTAPLLEEAAAPR